MSSSARTKSDCGTLMRRAFAVLRLITNSNLVGCSTGRSPALLHKVARRVGGWQSGARRQIDDRLSIQLSEAVGSDDERVGAFSHRFVESTAQAVPAAHIEKFCLEAKGTSRRPGLLPFGPRGRVAHVVQERNAREVRNQLLEKLDAFRRELGAEGSHSRDVASGPREARHEAVRIAHRRHDDGNRSRRVLGGGGRRRATGNDHIDLETHERGGELRESLRVTIGGPVFEKEVLALDVAQLAQASAQGVEVGRVLRLRYRLENADTVDPCSPLSVCGEGRRENAGGERANERSTINLSCS